MDFFRPTASTLEIFYGSDMLGMYFFLFTSCEPLSDQRIRVRVGYR